MSAFYRSDETEQKRAVAEGVLDRMSRKEWHQLDLLIAQTGDVQFWAEVLRYELDIRSMSPEILKRQDGLLEKLAELDVMSMSAFHYAGIQGDDRVIRKGLQFRLNIDVSLSDGLTVLHLASFAGKLELVVQLVDEFKANVNAEDRRQWRPLHYACAMGHKETVEFLTRRGADVGARDREGATAAYRARQHRHEPIVSCLLEFFGDGDILLLEEVDAHSLSVSPVYATPCRKDLPTTSNETDEVVKDDVPADWDQFESTGRQSMVQIQRKSRIQLKPSRRQGLKIDYEEIDLPQSTSSNTENTKWIESSSQSNTSETTFGKVSDVPIPGYPSRNPKRVHHYEEIRLPEDNNLPPELEKVDRGITRSKSGKAIEEPVTGNRSGCRKEINDYEELPEDIDLKIEDSEGNETVKQSATVMNSKPKSKERGYKKLPNHYEKIGLPGDDSSQPELSEDGLVSGNLPRRIDLLRKNFENEGVRPIDLPSFVFHRKPHHYEEIELPVGLDAHSQTEPLENEDVELRVRCLLRNELGKLVPSDFHRIDRKERVPPASRPTSEFIKEFFVAEKYSDGADRNVHDSSEDLITFRQLHRIIRQEIQLYTGNTYLENISKEFSDECLQSLNVLDKNSNSTISNHCFLEAKKEILSDDTERSIARINEDEEPGKHGNGETSQDIHCPAGSCTSSELKPQEKTSVSPRHSPGLFRRTFLDRKKEKSNSSLIQPNDPPSMKSDDHRPDSSIGERKSEQTPKQTGAIINSSNNNNLGSQSQFYVSLDDNFPSSEI